MSENREKKTNQELKDVELRVLRFDWIKVQDELDTMEKRETALMVQLAYLDARIEKMRDSEIMMKALHRTAVEDYTPPKETPGRPPAGIAAPPGIISPPDPSSGECDPNGTGAHTAGAKLDAGKPLAGLVLGDFSRALRGIVDVGTFGAKKYSPSGWTKVPGGVNRYKDALWRHLLELEETPVDSNSGLPALAHLCWNALAWLELVLRRQEMEADGFRESINEDAGC